MTSRYLESPGCLCCVLPTLPSPILGFLGPQMALQVACYLFSRCFHGSQEAGKTASCSPGSLTCSPGPPGGARACWDVVYTVLVGQGGGEVLPTVFTVFLSEALCIINHGGRGS